MTARPLLSLSLAFVSAAAVLAAPTPSPAADQAAGAPPPAPLRFQFAPGKAAAGYAHVPPDATYSDDRGYGFEPGADVTAVPGAGDDPLRAGCVTGRKPFYFSARVPGEGNYVVTVTLGDPAADAATTVKAELRRLMLEDVHTQAGQFVTRKFAVNTRTPDYPGDRVKLKAPRETTAEAWNWDNRLTLEFNGPHPAVSAVTIEPAPADLPTIFVLGDSTVCDQPHEPYASWGQMLPRFFDAGVAVANHAESGETLKSSTGAHRLDKVLASLKPGDTVLIQYGHNDMKSKDPDAAQQYKATLKKWAGQIRAKGGVPVLITPMHRHRFDGDAVVQSLGDYPDMARQAAAEESVALVDLNATSKTLYEALGPEGSIQFFARGVDPKDPKKFDATHHGPYGAYELARCVVEGIRKAKVDVAKRISDDPPPFDPAKPDPPGAFKVPPSAGAKGERPPGD